MLSLLLYHGVNLTVTMLAAQSLAFVWRCRMFHLGHTAFIAIGAYSSAIFILLFAPAASNFFLQSDGHRAAGLAFLLVSILVSGLFAGLVGLAVGRFLVRLRGDYFAVATLILSEALYRFITNIPALGGGLGFQAPYVVFSNSSVETLWNSGLFLAVSAACLAVFTGLFRVVDQSTAGLWIRSISDDPVAAESIGIDVGAIRTLVFALGAAGAGAAGAIMLYHDTQILPQDFNFISSIPLLTFVVLGRARPGRTALAVVTIYAFTEFLRLRGFGLLGSDLGGVLVDWNNAILGVLLIVFIYLAHRTDALGRLK